RIGIVRGKRHRRRAAKGGFQSGKLVAGHRSGRLTGNRLDKECRSRPQHAAYNERDQECTPERRRRHDPYISLLAASSMRETSASKAPWSLTGVRGGTAAGNTFLSSASRARTSLSAAASFFSRPVATLSIMRSASQMKPRAS